MQWTLKTVSYWTKLMFLLECGTTELVVFFQSECNNTAYFKCSLQMWNNKTKQKKLWNFKSLNPLSNNPNHIYKSVQNKKMGTIRASAMSDSNFLYPLMVVHNFPFHQKLWVSTVSLSKLKLTLHLSMCIKAAYSIAWHKLFFKQ